nr:40S ribosomal protein S3-3 [Ipomoea batatas]
MVSSDLLCRVVPRVVTCEVIVSGKLRAQSMKLKDGYMISSGQHGVLGIKVKIMLDWDPKGEQGPVIPLPDLVTIHSPKEEEAYIPSLIAAPPIMEAPIPIPVA